ncbi:MAG: PHP domain-containing protein [Chloroflexi bacterium]|jgi:3',5'-nucleoside bisphosphate phosphatase|nr:PHP domain-containing protein [Chloroflexota bacterium]MBT7081585.1 PHP domain-containing protein [Chloroflexota bacterium]MBT7289079.1 PHP domain-containing protein [Chloroflexota bacterium]
MKVDLHLHTTASDGSLTPAQLIKRAADQDIRVIAITDHDSVEGIPEATLAAKNYKQLTVIPGVEISTDVPGNEIHVLGLFVDYANQQLQAELTRLRVSRQMRAENMTAKLNGLGLSIEYERVLQLADGASVGRPHIAKALLEKGYISDFREAFDKYIGRNGPAYAEREKMLPQEAVKLIAQTGGLPVLAHPADIENLEELLPLYKKNGLIGIETYYHGYSMKTIDWLSQLANNHGLITTGGSDYHNDNGDAGGPLGYTDIPSKSIEQLLLLARQKGHLK